MKNYIIILIVMTCNLQANAQNENRFWYFGDNVGIDFGPNLNTPSIITGTPNSSGEGVASISDQNGNFMLYSDGIEIRSGASLGTLNTTSLTGHSSSSQSGIIVPSPCNCSDFIVFSVDRREAATSGNNRSIHYTVIATSGTTLSSVGPITQLTNDKSVEKITAVSHSNGSDYWILSPKLNSDEFIMYLMKCENNTPTFIPFNGTGLQKVTSVSNSRTFNKGNGYLKASHDSKYLGLTNYIDQTVELFAFNNTTGEIESIRNISSIPNAYGLEFSLDNNKVYWTSTGWASTQAILYESVILGNSINNFIIPPASGNQWYEAGALQLSPDKTKIYVALPGHNSLGSFSSNSTIQITEPGNFIRNAISFTSGNVKLGLPNIVNLNECPIVSDTLSLKCCETKLGIANPPNTPSILPVKNLINNGVGYSVASETFQIHDDAVIPITEIRVSVIDMIYKYDYESCGECISNPALWGSIFSDDVIGTNGLSPESQNYGFGSSGFLEAGANQREIIWSNPNGALLKDGDKFDVNYMLPPASEIPCCVTEVQVCTKISWKDANCCVTEINTCSTIELSPPPVCACKGSYNGGIKYKGRLGFEKEVSCGGKEDLAFNSLLHNSIKEIYTFTAPNYDCDLASCSASYEYEVIDYKGNLVISESTQSFTLSFPARGEYTVRFKPSCGGANCGICEISVNVFSKELEELEPQGPIVLPGGTIPILKPKK